MAIQTIFSLFQVSSMDSEKLYVLLVVGFSSLMSTHLVSAKTILDAQNAVLSDLPSILGTLYKKRELNNLLQTCFDGSHQYSTQGAYQRLQGISSDVHQDAAADFHLPPCLENFLYGENDDNCNHMQNNSWYAILKDEFADVALLNSEKHVVSEKEFIDRICSSWKKLMSLKGQNGKENDKAYFNETSAQADPDQFVEDTQQPKEDGREFLEVTEAKDNQATDVATVPMIRNKRFIFSKRQGYYGASQGGDSIGALDAVALFASFAALGVALYVSLNTNLTSSAATGTSSNTGSSVNGSPVTITANSPNTGTVNIAT